MDQILWNLNKSSETIKLSNAILNQETNRNVNFLNFVFNHDDRQFSIGKFWIPKGTIKEFVNYFDNIIKQKIELKYKANVYVFVSLLNLTTKKRSSILNKFDKQQLRIIDLLKIAGMDKWDVNRLQGKNYFLN